MSKQCVLCDSRLDFFPCLIVCGSISVKNLTELLLVCLWRVETRDGQLHRSLQVQQKDNNVHRHYARDSVGSS